MRIGRSLPPAAAPLGWRDLLGAVPAVFAGARAVAAREQELRRAFDVSHVFLVSSGSAALALSLAALASLSGKRDVVIPAYTCFSVPAAVLKAGLRPVLCDIEPSTFDFAPGALERALTPGTLCVVAHHLFGIPSAVERARAVCAGRGIFVVEDAAQAMGTEVGGRKLGTLGDVGIFSFGRGKHVTCGSGGAILTRSGAIAAAVGPRYRALPPASVRTEIADAARAFAMALFIRPRLFWIPAGLPFLRLGETIFPDDVPVRRLGGVKAGLLRGWARRLARAHASRLEVSAYFADRLPLPAGSRHPYLRLPLLAPSPRAKREWQAASRTRGLGLSGAYPTPVSEIPQIRDRFAGRQFPAAAHVAERLLTIPNHEWVTPRDRQAIADLCLAGRPS
jgi:dTDP-4-amino-4,6-dideoxygalactose transaminase